MDGRPLDFGETADHFIWFRCSEGQHEVSVSAPLGTVRLLCLAISLLAVLMCIAALAFLRRKHQTNGSGSER